jgi:hypothetical protein
MSALLYAIADRPLETDGLGVVGDGPVAIVKSVTGAVSRTPDALREHMQTVAALMREHAVLPARYGTVLEEAEIERLLAEQREPLLAAIERVRGAVEVAVHARAAAALTPEPAPPRSGTEYLHRRLEEQCRLDDLEAALAPLAELARATTARRDGTTWAYLVERERLAEFVAAVRALDRRRPELELVCTGPWPPYSFAGDFR